MDILENEKYVNLEVTADQINTLVNCSSDIIAAAQTANKTKFELENNTTFVFDGSNAQKTGQVFIVDDALSSESKNAIQNRIVTSELNRLAGLVSKQSIVDAIYPVGSLYFGVSNTSPATNFPETEWQFVSTAAFDSIITYIYKRTK